MRGVSAAAMPRSALYLFVAIAAHSAIARSSSAGGHGGSVLAECGDGGVALLQTGVSRGHEVHAHDPAHRQGLAAGAPRAAPALLAAGASAGGLCVVALFVALGALCAASLAAYAWASSEGEGEEEATAAAGAAVMKATDDSALDLASPAMAEARRLPTFARRSSIVVGELKHRHWTIEDASDTMSKFEFVVNMFADLGPPGLLPLAHGLKDTGYLPGFAMLIGFYGLCVYTMYAVAQTTEITGAKDYASQWTRAIGPGSSWVPVAVVTLVCFGCNLSYSCFVADIFAGVMPALGLNMSRSQCLLALTLFPILPLCLLKNLSALSKSSSFAVVAVIYTAVFMCRRAFDGSYAEGGTFFADLSPTLRPQAPLDSHMLGFGMPSLSLVNGLALAFISHYNGCKYYRELEGHTPARLSKCTAFAMGICVVVFGATMWAGFHTFGTNADSVILKNYSEHDTLANVARVGMGLSIVASFPLMFSGLREAVVTLLKSADPMKSADWDLVWKQDALSLFMLAILTGLALVIQDAGVVVGLVGAICGSAVIYMVPCSLYAASIRGFLTERSNLTLVWLRCLTAFGIVLAATGCYSALAF